jgi:WhiB family transcriptional regulator, redox-sensing transcriptional regulator
MGRSEHPALRQLRWQQQAACRPYPTWWWFTADCPEAVEAFVVCTNCRVREDCLNFAVDHPELVGIWAATTERDRAELRRVRREVSADRHRLRPRADPVRRPPGDNRP